MTKHKKSKNKCDKMQKDRIQIWQNAKGQITNVTKCKTTYYKHDKIQNVRIQIRQNAKDNKQMWQNTKHQNTKRNPALGRQIANTTNYKKSKSKYDKIQKD